MNDDNKPADTPAPPEQTPPDDELPFLVGDDAPPADEPPPPPVLVPVVEKPKKKRNKKKPARGAAPDVSPANDANPRAPFEGGPPEELPVDPEPDVAPAAASSPPSAKQVRKKRLEPKKVAAKVAGAIDKGAVFIANARYKDLTGAPMMMPLALLAQLGVPGIDPSTTELIPIASLAAASPDERAELEADLLDVLSEFPIMLTPAQAVLLSCALIYGAKGVMMEQIAGKLYKQPDGAK